MDAGGLDNIIIKQLEPGDKVSGLKLGHADFAPLKQFVQKDAKHYERLSMGRTYTVYEAGQVALKAYMTLVCGEVVIGENSQPLVDDDALHYPYKSYPAVKIARLAVHSKLRGSGLGQTLVGVALSIAKDKICPAVGCRFMMVDAKKSSVSFYTRCGFTLLDTMKNKALAAPVMYIDLNRA